MVLRGNRQKRIKPFAETRRILLPQQIMQKHAHRIHANAFRPSQLFVDLLRIEGSLLPTSPAD